MQEPQQTVHLVFKTHLDLGFTDLARNVVDQYIEKYIPQAISLARSLREAALVDRFVWTTGSWLVYEYLEKADAPGRSNMEEAIAHGDILWHALPFTTHSELMDPLLFSYGLSLSKRLDRRFGRNTIAAKMTDVPGHTRSIVPLLAEAGVIFLHIGVNPACPVPKVPPIFRWRDEKTDSEVTVMYNPDYGTPSPVRGTNETLWIASTGDNEGPHLPAKIQQIYDNCRKQIPSARVVSSSLDDFARAILPIAPNLPIVTDEIGDTWIHGAATDPAKISAFRELCRLRQRWLDRGRCSLESLDGFQAELLKVPEHTWGLDEKTHLHDYKAYRICDMAPLRGAANFRLMEESWKEQREYINAAIGRLPNPALADEAKDALARLAPKMPISDGMRELSLPGASVDIGNFTIGLDSITGAICRLLDRRTGVDWASAQQQLCLVKYQVFGSRDYDRFLNQYVRPTHLVNRGDWPVLDLSKPGIEDVLIDGLSWNPSLTSAFVEDDDSGAKRLLLNLALPDECNIDYGAPRKFTLEISRTTDDALDIVLQWFDKPATRMAEALWLSFTSDITDWGRWELQKMQQPVSPTEVASKGGRRFHAISADVAYTFENSRFCLQTLDAPLIAMGEAALLDFDDSIPSARQGVHVNLYNNVWGSNFPMWNEDDARFRFKLSVE